MFSYQASLFFLNPQCGTIPYVCLFPELLNCFSPTPQRKSWHSLLATTGELCGRYFFFLLFVEQKTEQTSRTPSHFRPCVCAAAPRASGTRPCAFTTPLSRRSRLTCAAWPWPAAVQDSSPRASVVRTVTVRFGVHAPEWARLSSCCCFVAYERALAVASTESEKSYISTALALLLHRQGDVDSAKTLLFKWWAHSVAYQAET